MDKCVCISFSLKKIDSFDNFIDGVLTVFNPHSNSYQIQLDFLPTKPMSSLLPTHQVKCVLPMYS